MLLYVYSEQEVLRSSIPDFHSSACDLAGLFDILTGVTGPSYRGLLKFSAHSSEILAVEQINNYYNRTLVELG